MVDKKEEETIPRKWEFIANTLKKIAESESHAKNQKAIKIAEEIDNTLVKLYGKEHPAVWIEEYKRFYKNFDFTTDSSDLWHIISHQRYCIACEKTPTDDGGVLDCGECEFAEKHGECDEDDNSLFGIFINECNI